MNLMRLNLSRMAGICTLLLFAPVFMATAGCGSDGGQNGQTSAAAVTAVPAPAGAGAVKDQNACHLFTHEEVSTLMETKISVSDQTDAGDTWSTCEWNNDSGTAPFTLTVYWIGGKQEWETWRAAQGLGNQVMEQAEGVSVDNVVKQGPVAGIGDAAYFSGLLPSLVLKGDVMFEMNLFFVPNAETRFASLTQKLLANID